MSLAQQPCPQCDTIMRAPATTAVICPNCGAIATLGDGGTLRAPTTSELDQLLARPEIRRAIEQASAIRQALFGGRFTLADPTTLLDPEPHPSLAAAVARGAQKPWSVVPWVVIDPSGHVAAHRSRPERTPHQ